MLCIVKKSNTTEIDIQKVNSALLLECKENGWFFVFADKLAKGKKVEINADSKLTAFEAIYSFLKEKYVNRNENDERQKRGFYLFKVEILSNLKEIQGVKNDF